MKKILPVLLALIFSTVCFGQITSKNVLTNKKSYNILLNSNSRDLSSLQQYREVDALTKLTYFDEGKGITALGAGAGKEFISNAMIYLPTETVVEHTGKKLTKIAIFVNDNGENIVNSLKIRIWTDTSDVNSPAYEQEVTNITSGWNEVELTTPYTLGTEPIFVGYFISGVGFIIGVEEDIFDVNPNGYGDLMETGGNFVHLSEVPGLAVGDLAIIAFLGDLDSLDIELKSIDIDNILEIEDINIKGTVVNKSDTTPLTSYDVVYSVDGGENSAVYSVSDLNIAVGATHQFTHDIPYALTQPGKHSVKVTISNPNGENDQNENDNVMIKDIFVVNEIFPKTVVYEEATGTWNGLCVRGIVGRKDMAYYHDEDSWIGIAVHAADPMESEWLEAMKGKIPDYPSGFMNRRLEAIFPGLEYLEEKYEEHLNTIPLVKANITFAGFYYTDREIEVTAQAIFALDLDSANYSMAMGIVEDKVTGTGEGWEQANHYSGVGDLIDYEGINYKDLPDPIPASDMVYNHVGRALIGGWNGIDESIPTSVKYNTPYEYKFSHTLPYDQNVHNIKVVIFIIDRNTGEIVNATQTSEIAIVGVNNIELDNVNIYPNPTNGLFRVEGVQGAKVVVYNIVGDVVYNNTNASENINIDLSSQKEGSYIVKITNDAKVSTHKIIVTK